MARAEVHTCGAPHRAHFREKKGERAARTFPPFAVNARAGRSYKERQI